MNAPIIEVNLIFWVVLGVWMGEDPLQGDFPEVIEEFLQHGNMKCIAFNRRGTLLAAGCANGSCVIWDFETRGVAKELRDKACVAPITSVCWSKYGHYLLASATDKSLTLWNVVNGEKITHITLQQTTLHARLHPGSCTPSLCLACPLSSAPILVDLNNGTSTVLPVSVTDNTNGNAVSHPRNKFSDSSLPFTPTAATFDKHGDLIYLGNSKGEILIVDPKNVRVNALIPIPGGSVVKDIVFSRNGQYLLTNSNDRVIRVYESLLPTKGAAKELEIMSDTDDKFPRIEKLKEVGTKCLRLSREFQDAVTKIQWKAPCFSGDGEWVIGASASKGEHKLYIWDRAGHLVKILEGPKEALIDLAWHPLRPLVVSVSVAGLVYIWAKDYTENWSAFAPDFKELEENEEYVEREDEFDLMPESEKVKELVINQDEEVDILTVEKDSAFSDSDASQEELCFLPAVPFPDPEQQDKCLGSSLKLGDSNHTGSPFSVEAAQNGQAILPASSPLEVVGNSTPEEAVGTAGMKRKRKPSAKGMELQAEKGRKPQTKNKSSGKTSKPRSRSGDGIDTNGSVLEDDVTDEYL
ncbi:WD domain, G-beta repeat [Musa troglodytarum]|uniref:WD domain, G-beta repeat n=1 Tax=Musa troglodytarum TaxID=320322 RepID=A0A9E7JCG7_9LILI|nr:WD domain, G-beta repeat [Musa troglodytarum]